MIWNKKDINRTLVRDMVRKYECDALTASILARRNIVDGPDVLYFMEDDLRYIHNPFLFHDMEDAVDRVLLAREEGEKVLIFGDRDVDGITSTALLHQALTDLSMDVQWRVPSGDDPYGLTVAAVEAHAENAGTLIITVDNGISCRDAVARANELGIDTVILDHHNPPDILPEAVAIIDPKMEDSGYPFRDLAGCAVAWKFILALRFSQSELYKQQICLLNVRPANESYIIEAVKMVNLTETGRICETVIPGMVSITQTRLLPFLQDQQILVWDAPLQHKQLALIFGKGVEFNFHDLESEISREIPAIRNMSLLRLKDFSRIGRYLENPISELDGFCNLFVTFIQRRNTLYGQKEKQELQLVALGTLADLMPLENENRILVKQGLSAINEHPRPGLAELMARQNLTGKKIGTSDIAWLISPAINATGRMGTPEVAVSLLLSDNQADRNRLSEEVIRLNTDRKQLGADAWIIAEPLARESLEKHHGKLVVAADSQFHRGITGIMANRLSNCFQVPAIVMSFMPDNTLVGSMRSARGVNLQDILEPCADLFIDHGGHTFAAGFSLHEKDYPEFRARLVRIAADITFPESENGGEVSIDAELPHEYLTPSILDLTDRFEPYGEGNDPITFLTRNMKIISADIMGKTDKLHLKLTVACGTYKWPAVYWRAAERLGRDFAVGDAIDTVFTVGRNSFNGSEIPQLILQDVQKPEGA